MKGVIQKLRGPSKATLLLAIGLSAGYFLWRNRINHFVGIGRVPPVRAFYFWKTRWEPSAEILSALNANRIQKLYVRFFDVQWNRGKSEPVSPLEFAAKLPANLDLVPVVYFTNAVFLKTPYAEVEKLSENVLKKINLMATEQGVSFRQLQVDCDWSEGSRRNYFHFVEILRKKLNPLDIALSATIRLHQIKYYARTGIPPADRGMLMFYNFGRIKADSDRSSIFNKQDAIRYTSYIEGYRLPLDVSLPIFSWVVQSRDGKIIRLVSKTDSDDLIKVENFKRLSPDRFTATKSFFYHGSYYAEGDSLLVESTRPALTEAAAHLAVAGAQWKSRYDTVAFFDIDERNLDHYGKNEIDKIFKQF